MAINSGYLAWKKDKERREKNPTFKEASMKGRLTYADPTFESKSAEKSTKWESELLKSLPVKGYGRSYNDKLSNALNEIGLPEAEHENFRKFMDSQEQGVQSNVQKQDEIFNFIKSRDDLDAERRIREANGQPFKRDWVDKNATSDMWEPSKREEPKAKERDGVLGFLDSTVGRVSKGAQERVFGEKFVDEQAKMYEENGNDEVKRMQASINSEADTTQEKIFDFLGAATGEIAPYALGYGAADKAMKASKVLNGIRNPIAKDLTRGAMASFGGESLIQGSQLASGEDKSLRDAASQIGLSTVLGGGIDAGIGIVGRKIISRLSKGDTVEQIAREEGVSPQEVEQVVHQTMDDFSPEQLPKWDQQFDPLGFIEKSGTRDLPEFGTPEVQVPDQLKGFNPLDDFLNFGQRGSVKPRPQMVNPMDELMNKRPTGYFASKWDEVANADPKQVFQEEIDSIVAQQEALHGHLADREKQFIEENVQRALRGDAYANNGAYQKAQQLESSLPKEQTKPLSWDDEKYPILYNDPRWFQENEQFQKMSEAESEFEQIVKQAKQLKKEFKDKHGKVYIPKDNWNDFKDVPRAFRAPKNSTEYEDIYKVADDMGMSPDELVQYLSKINTDSGRTKKSIMQEKGVSKNAPKDIRTKIAHMDYLESQIKKEWEAKNGLAKDPLDELRGEVPQVEDVFNEKLIPDGKHTSHIDKVQEEARRKLITPGTVFSHKGKDFTVKEVKGNAVHLTNGKKVPINSLILQADGNIRYQKETATIPNVEDPFSFLGSDTPASPPKVSSSPELDGLIAQIANPKITDEASLRQELKKVFDNDPETVASQRVLDALGEDYASYSNGSKAFMYDKLKGEGDPATLEDLADYLGKDLKDLDKASFIDSLNSDPRIREGIKGLTSPKREPQPEIPTVNTLDDLFQSESLGQNVEPGQVDDPFSYLQEKGVTQGDSSPISPDSTGEASPKSLRINLQAFDGKREKVSDSLVNKSDNVESKDAISQIKNPFSRWANKGYEQVVNARHSLHVADKLRTQAALEKAKDPEAVSKLTTRLEQLKKRGSQIEKASANEESASVMTQSLLNRHFDGIQKSLKKGKVDVKDAIQYQLAKNIRYIMDNVDPDYKLPKGWDGDRINQIINTAEFGDKKEVFKESAAQFKGMMDEVRQLMLDYDLKPQEEIDLLAKNEHYIPMFRDRSWKDDNIATGNKNNRKSSNSVLDLYGLEGGEIENYLKNPLESIAELTHTVVRKGLQNDTALSLKRLAEIETDLAAADKDNAFKNGLVRFAAKGETPDIVGIEEGQEFRLKLQQGIKDVLEEGRDIHLPSGFAANLTRTYAGLKTRTFAHQLVAAPRDLIQGYFNSQIRNPVKYLGELGRVIKDSNMDAKKIGAYFDQGYNTHTGGVKEHEKLVKEFVRQHKGMSKFDLKSPRSWIDLVDKVNPARYLGQLSDESMRSVEARATQNRFQPEIDKLRAEVEQMSKQTDFADEGKGLAEKTQQLKDLEKQQRREMIYDGRDMMNYSRTGRAGMVRNVIKPYAIFANTTTQSKDRFFRQLKRDPIGTTAKVSVPVAGMYFIQQGAYESATDEQKKTLDLAPDYVKNYYYMFPDGKDGWTLVPKPHEAIPIITGIEAAAEEYLNTRENKVGDPMNEWFRLLAQEYVPLQGGNLVKGAIPDRYGKADPQTDSTLPGTAATPFLDVLLNNKTAFNRKQVSGDNPYTLDENEGSLVIPEGMTQEDMSAPWTPEYAKKLGGNKVNADHIDYLVKDLLGDNSAAVRNQLDGDTKNPLMQLLKDTTIRKYKRDAYMDSEKKKYLKKE